MNFAERINSLLRPKPEGKIRVLDLFAGCGGLLAAASRLQGFDTFGYEQDADACETYRRNLKGDCKQITLTTETQFPKADVIIGGPPVPAFQRWRSSNGIERFERRVSNFHFRRETSSAGDLGV